MCDYNFRNCHAAKFESPAVWSRKTINTERSKLRTASAPAIRRSLKVGSRPADWERSFGFLLTFLLPS